ncbi:MAG: hypothetical protein QGH20_11925 [Candidatus Latescibacteria bacterium]|nr:hypothetical protein [Candidatus Latescibacterota bacterium]
MRLPSGILFSLISRSTLPAKSAISQEDSVRVLYPIPDAPRATSTISNAAMEMPRKPPLNVGRIAAEIFVGTF